MQQLNKWWLLAQQAGAILTLLGAALYIVLGTTATIIYGIGAVLFAATQAKQQYNGRNIVIMRLRRQQMFGAALLVATCPAMIFFQHNEWIVCLTVACVLELYTAFRLPSELEKEHQSDNRR